MAVFEKLILQTEFLNLDFVLESLLCSRISNLLWSLSSSLGYIFEAQDCSRVCSQVLAMFSNLKVFLDCRDSC